jgi:TRAP-type mannitol/chloroaromatic compound transport system substrate-binding protein
VRAAQHAGPSGSEVQFETSSWPAGRSLIVEGAARVAHKAKRWAGGALSDTGSAAGST